MMRRVVDVMMPAAAPLLAVTAALSCGAFLVLALGRNPADVYALLARETFGSWYGIGQVLFKATPLLATGLAVAMAFRAGLFNVGAEGQMILGGLTAAVVALSLPDDAPAALAVATVIAAAGAGGAAWAVIPGFLRARFGVHEVIVTILLNFIATALASFVLVTTLAQFETLHSAAIPPPARLARLESVWPALRGAPVNTALLVTLAACVAVDVALWRTRWGFEVRAAGASPAAARAAGIAVSRRVLQAMLCSGALAGIAACNFVQGYKYYYEDGFSADAGFRGIAVALLARNHPLALIPAALLFGALDRGGFVLGRMVPKEFVDVLQALVLLFVVLLTPLGRRIAARRAAGAR
jgi:simple sugar transport system permease protein